MLNSNNAAPARLVADRKIFVPFIAFLDFLILRFSNVSRRSIVLAEASVRSAHSGVGEPIRACAGVNNLFDLPV
jgi:hypothetical protein